ncbi:hypothetical protein [Thiothrix caldifontis]|nr:hypothetical protein [Thiothrix caldifontis]
MKVMKKSAILACAFAAVFLAGCSVFEQSAELPDKDKTPPVANTGAGSSKPVPPTIKPDPKPKPSPIVNAPGTPDEYFREWIKQDGNKAVLQAWLNKKPGAPKDIDKFLSEAKYKDLRYEAYADLKPSK